MDENTGKVKNEGVEVGINPDEDDDELVYVDAHGEYKYDPELVAHYPPEPTRSKRNHQATQRFSLDAILSMVIVDVMRNGDHDNPLTVREDLSGAEAQQWKNVMREEMIHMKERCVCNLISRPENCRLITSR